MKPYIGIPPDWSEIQTEWRPPIRRGIHAQPLDLTVEEYPDPRARHRILRSKRNKLINEAILSFRKHLLESRQEESET